MKYLGILIVCIMISACSGRINLIAELPKDQDLDVSIKTSTSGKLHNTPTAEWKDEKICLSYAPNFCYDATKWICERLTFKLT